MNAPLTGLRLPVRLSGGSDSTTDTDDSLDLRQALSTLWRGKIIIGLLGFLGAFAGWGWAVNIAVPAFEATAVLVLEAESKPVIQLDALLQGSTGDNTLVNTEVEVLKSRSLLSAVVAAEGLTDDPEFNSQLRPEGITEKFRVLVSDWMPFLTDLGPKAEPSERRGRTLTIDQLSEQITVRNVPDSMVFELVMESASPEKAARIINTLADIYIERQIETKFLATEQAASWLTDRVATLKQELQRAESAAASFSAEMELINEDTLEALSQQLKDVRIRIRARQGDPARPAAQTPRQIQQIAALTNLEKDLEQRISRQSQDLVTLEELAREADASRQIYEYFLSRLKETSVQQGIQQADSRILTRAEQPELPSRPRVGLATLMAGVLSMIFTAMIVLAREAGLVVFRNEAQLEEATGLPVLGVIPRFPPRRRKSVLKYLIRKPNSAAVEAIRNLRTSIMIGGKQEPRVIMITSSVPKEGKTTLSLGLAQSMAGLDKKVLLIEGDLRRQTFRSYFAMPTVGGVADVVRGRVALSAAVMSDDKLGIDYLAGMADTANAADILSGRGYARLIRDARKFYDIVIIDTPPILVVPDARVAAPHADAILYCVHWDHTHESLVRTGISSLDKIGVQIGGLVLTRIDTRMQRRYGVGGAFDARGYYQS